MLSNEELKERFRKIHPEYVLPDSKGGYKWKQARIFTSILYPENIENLVDSCISFGVPCSVSPLHDSDLKDVETGELKKPHYHFICYYKGKTTPWNFYTQLVGAFGESAFSTFEIGNDLGGLVRYSCHLDNPDKTKYNISDINDFNGFHSEKYLFDNGVDLMSNLDFIYDYVEENNILFFSELERRLRVECPEVRFAIHSNRDLKRDIIDYMKSREHELFYSGGVEKGYTKIKMENGTEKVIFNRQIKAI